MKWNEVRDRILEGNFKMNAYARTYFDALHQSFIEYGEHGLKTQIIYIFSNIRARKGVQQTIKKELMKYANSRR